MKLNKLLQRQLDKYLPASCKDKPEFQEFLNAVHNSYESFERDVKLSERVFRITEEEYLGINDRLKHELDVRNTSIHRLREAISVMSGRNVQETEDAELLELTNFLTHEIDRRIETERQLEEQKAFYERILSQIPADIAIIDKDQRYLFVNPSAIKDEQIRKWIVGKTEVEYAEYRNRPLAQLEERQKRFSETVRAGVRREWEEKIIKPDGTVEHHLRVLHPVLKSDGSLEMMVIYGFNITERKQIEEKIRLSETRFRSIFNNSQALICTHDLNGVVLDVNPASTKTFGYDRDEMVGTNIMHLLPEDRKAAFKSSYLSRIVTDGRVEGVMKAYDKEGRKLYLLYQNYLVNDTGEAPYIIGFAQDISLRVQAEKALRESEEKYRSIIANMNLGLIEVDDKEHIVYINHSFCEMSGYEEEDLIGQHAAALLLKGDNREMGEDVRERRRQGESDAYEVKVKDKRGHLKWWLVSGAPIINNDGLFKGSIGIHLDITKQKELESELREAKAAAEQSSYAKEIFLANISHEIRTPMNAILGITRLLQKTPLSDQQNRFLNTIHAASNNLLIIINDLLDFSKIESGKVVMESIPYDLYQVVHNVAHILGFKAEERGLKLAVEWDASIHKVIVGDPYRMNQILINLVGNAIKFTEKGSVTIICEAATMEQSIWQKVTIRVKDTGIGMNEQFQQQLFEKFTQEDESITRKFGGTGLGMSITKQLVELMGGKISVASQKNVGTTISFTLTCAPGKLDSMLPEADNIIAVENSLEGIRILLVEDNEMNRLLATTILKQSGATVTEATNGLASIHVLESGETFDIILMDVQMPIMDGLEATRHIRRELGMDLPVLALTASAFSSEKQKCLEAGMNDYIAKPFEEAELIRTILALVHKKWNETTQASADASEWSAPPLFDLSKLKETAKGDTVFLERMIGLFIKLIPDTLTQIDEARHAQDWNHLAAMAHKLKPSVLSIGVLSIKEDILLLENLKEVTMPEPEIDYAIDHLQSTLNAVVDSLKEYSFT